MQHRLEPVGITGGGISIAKRATALYTGARTNVTQYAR
jgi:hypothetical protein